MKLSITIIKSSKKREMESFERLNLCMTVLAVIEILGDKQSSAPVSRAQHLMKQLSCSYLFTHCG